MDVDCPPIGLADEAFFVAYGCSLVWPNTGQYSGTNYNQKQDNWKKVKYEDWATNKAIAEQPPVKLP
jgi:hypothetical protein